MSINWLLLYSPLLPHIGTSDTYVIGAKRYKFASNHVFLTKKFLPEPGWQKEYDMTHLQWYSDIVLDTGYQYMTVNDSISCI